MARSKPKQRKTLEDWQLEDAQRLKKIFQLRSEQFGFTQETFARQHGLYSQANLSQYLNGRMGLSIETAARFARGLLCSIADFSPTIANQLAELGLEHRGVPLAKSQESLTETEKAIISFFRRSGQELKNVMVWLSSFDKTADGFSITSTPLAAFEAKTIPTKGKRKSARDGSAAPK